VGELEWSELVVMGHSSVFLLVGGLSRRWGVMNMKEYEWT